MLHVFSLLLYAFLVLNFLFYGRVVRRDERTDDDTSLAFRRHVAISGFKTPRANVLIYAADITPDDIFNIEYAEIMTSSLNIEGFEGLVVHQNDISVTGFKKITTNLYKMCIVKAHVRNIDRVLCTGFDAIRYHRQ